MANIDKNDKMSRLIIADDQLSNAMNLLSVERMAALKSITGSERDAIELHGQMLKTAATLMPVTAMLEICLRNAVSEKLRALFGTNDWLQNPPIPFAWRGEEKSSIKRAQRHAQRAVYAKLNHYQKKRLDQIAFPQGIPPNTSHETRTKARQVAIVITQGQLIAQLTFLFRKRVFSSDYASSLWDRSLKTIFPDKSMQRPTIAQNLEILHQSRNRIAHHEPVYGSRLNATNAAIDFIAKGFGDTATNGGTLVETMIASHRKSLHDEATKLSGMIASYTVQNIT